MTDYSKEMGHLCSHFGIGVALVVGAYTLLGATRAYRDYFQLELFQAVGLAESSALFATSEFTVSLFVLASTAGFGLVDDNRAALDVILRVAAPAGLGLAALSVLHGRGAIGGLAWMIGVGACTFLAYVPLGTMLFDRLLGAAHEDMTSALLNLLMDASVLVGTASLLCYKDFVQQPPAGAGAAEAAKHMYDFFAAACWHGGIAIALLLVAANVSLGRAVDRRRRVVTKLDAASTL